jgi:hypothetical protein
MGVQSGTDGCAADSQIVQAGDGLLVVEPGVHQYRMAYGRTQLGTAHRRALRLGLSQ